MNIIGIILVMVGIGLIIAGEFVQYNKNKDSLVSMPNYDSGQLEYAKNDFLYEFVAKPKKFGEDSIRFDGNPNMGYEILVDGKVVYKGKPSSELLVKEIKKEG
jgi:hypothetical protein